MYPASPARFLQHRPGDEAAGAVKKTHLSQVDVDTWRPLPGEHVDGRMLQLTGVTASTSPETTIRTAAGAPGSTSFRTAI
jgi:hypothetical protein